MDKEEVIQLIENKLTAIEIANYFGKSESTVRRFLKKHDLKTFRHVNHNPNAKEKECRYCGEVKEINQFPVSSSEGETVYYRHKCNRCYLDGKTERRTAIREWLYEVKKDFSCQHCGNNDYRVIQFHHHNNDKDFNVADMPTKGFSKDRITKELAKCIPLCANCHSILHYEERNSDTGR